MRGPEVPKPEKDWTPAMSDLVPDPDRPGSDDQFPATPEEWIESMTPLGKIKAAVDSVSSKRDEVDEQLIVIETGDEWREALTLIHATAKEWYSLRNRMMDAYLQVVRRENKETQ